MADDIASATSTPTKKKLPFKPTALRRQAPPKPTSSDDAPAEGDDGLNLFRRSREMAPIVAADRERRLRKKQKQEERRRSSAGGKRFLDDDDEAGEADAEAQEQRLQDELRAQDDGDEPVATDESMTVREDSSRDLVTPPPSKRSRVGSTSSKKAIGRMGTTPLPSQDSPSARLLRSHPKEETAHPAVETTPQDKLSNKPEVIDIESDAEEDASPFVTPSKRRESSVEVIDDPVEKLSLSPEKDDEDEEFGEYIRQAEVQRARQQAIQDSSSNLDHDKETVEILVNSTIPGSKALCAKFTFDKSLRLIRNTWLASQLKHGVQLSPEQQAGVVLTWRKKRVYNTSTLLNLGIRPQGRGRVAVDGHSRDGLNETSTRVFMQAWTPELFAAMEREEERRRREEAGEIVEDDEEEVQELPEVKIRVILRARNLADVKLTVRPETTAETIINGYKLSQPTVVGKDVSIWFDGEKLEEHVTMADREIDDMDTIEVHVK